MKAVLAVIILGFAMSQLHIVYYHPEKVHGFSMQYHPLFKLLLATNATTCYFVDVTMEIEIRLRHRATRSIIEEEVYNQIISHKGETVSSIDKIVHDTHDIKAVTDCLHHDVYQMTYTPSS